MNSLRIFTWHMHGSYTNALVQGRHHYLLPSLPQKGPYGMGRADTWEWPATTENVSPVDARDLDVDLVLLQRPEEVDLAEAWLGGRRPGRDVPALFLEHNSPQGRVNDMQHPMKDGDIPVVHVTHFNRLFWDCGSTPTSVIEHGVVDPGHRYTGELERAAVVINEPVRRARVTGTDLIEQVRMRSDVDVDLFGMKSEVLGGYDLPQSRLLEELPRRRVYLHTARWTSLGLSLIEAMLLGMPVVTLATTEAAEVLPLDVGVKSNDVDVLAAAVRSFVDDPESAQLHGKRARSFALQRFGIDRFLDDWDRVFGEVVS
jgi:hypothetical protein